MLAGQPQGATKRAHVGPTHQSTGIAFTTPNRAASQPGAAGRSGLRDAAAGSTSWCRCRPAASRPASPAARLGPLLGVGVPEGEVRRRQPLPARRRGHVGPEVGQRQPRLLPLDRGRGSGVREQRVDVLAPATTASRAGAARPASARPARCSRSAGGRGRRRRARPTGRPASTKTTRSTGRAAASAATYSPALLCGTSTSGSSSGSCGEQAAPATSARVTPPRRGSARRPSPAWPRSAAARSATGAQTAGPRQRAGRAAPAVVIDAASPGVAAERDAELGEPGRPAVEGGEHPGAARGEREGVLEVGGRASRRRWRRSSRRRGCASTARRATTIGSTASARPSTSADALAGPADVGHVRAAGAWPSRCRGRCSPRRCRSRPAPRT